MKIRHDFHSIRNERLAEFTCADTIRGSPCLWRKRILVDREGRVKLQKRERTWAEAAKVCMAQVIHTRGKFPSKNDPFASLQLTPASPVPLFFPSFFLSFIFFLSFFYLPFHNSTSKPLTEQLQLVSLSNGEYGRHLTTFYNRKN